MGRKMIPRFNLVFVALSAYVSILACRAQIYVDEPPHLVGYIQGSTAAFGTPTYGAYIVGQLLYSASGNPDMPHCEDDYADIPLDTLAEVHVSKIVMVRRGGCHFAEKVLTAENKGADAVIVVDNDPLRTAADIRMIIMAEDEGIKEKIEIPSILISYEQGEKLIQGILDGEDVFARLEWDIPNAETVEIDHWNSPALTQSVKFLHSFAPVARVLKNKLDFRPHFWIFPLVRDYKTMCSDSTGRFCAINAEWGEDATGKAVVEESVRQKCLWRESSKSSNGTLSYPRAYWDYVERFPSFCPATNKGERVFGEECSFELMRSVDAPLPAIKQCYENEAEDILSEEKYTVAWSPTATMINNWRYAGPLTPDGVSAAICTGFFEEPEECKYLLKTVSGETSVETSTGVPWWIYLITVLAVVLGMLAAVVCYRVYLYKKLRNELRYEVFEEVKSRTQGPKRQSDKVSTGAGDASTGRGEDFNESGGAKPVRSFDGVYTQGVA